MSARGAGFSCYFLHGGVSFLPLLAVEGSVLCFCIYRSEKTPKTLREFWGTGCDFDRTSYALWCVLICPPLNVVVNVIINMILSWKIWWRNSFHCHYLLDFLKICCCGVSWQYSPVELHWLTCKILVSRYSLLCTECSMHVFRAFTEPGYSGQILLRQTNWIREYAHFRIHQFSNLFTNLWKDFADCRQKATQVPNSI